MLTKEPKQKFGKWFKRGALTLFAAEAIAFAVSYSGWHKVNTDRDTRKYLRDNFPSLLESYYKVGEYLDANSRIRQIDIAHWQAEE